MKKPVKPTKTRDIRPEMKVDLPRTVEAFDQLVQDIITCFKFGPDLDPKQIAGIVSVALRRLPNDCGSTTIGFLGNTVVRQICAQICNFKSQVISAEIKAETLIHRLAADPNDQQSLDELQQFANDKLPMAEKFIKRFYDDNPDKLITEKIETTKNQVAEDPAPEKAPEDVPTIQ